MALLGIQNAVAACNLLGMTIQFVVACLEWCGVVIAVHSVQWLSRYTLRCLFADIGL